MKKKCIQPRFLHEGDGNLLKKMKLLIVFFFTGLLSVSAGSYSRQTTLSMMVDEATVKEASVILASAMKEMLPVMKSETPSEQKKPLPAKLRMFQEPHFQVFP